MAYEKSVFALLAAVSICARIALAAQQVAVSASSLEHSRDEWKRIDNLLAEVAETYATADSYTDEGVSSTLYMFQSRMNLEFSRFSTAYVKSRNSFRYELQPGVQIQFNWIGEGIQPRLGQPSTRFGGGAYWVCMRGGEIQTWCPATREVGYPGSLTQALYPVTRRSIGAVDDSAIWLSIFLPNLIHRWRIAGTAYNQFDQLRPASMFRLTKSDAAMVSIPLDTAGLELTDAHSLPEREIDGVSCVGISGKNGAIRTQTMWIEKDRKLIRSIQYEWQFLDFRAWTTITYKPDINVDIPKEKFELNIPGNGGK